MVSVDMTIPMIKVSFLVRSCFWGVLVWVGFFLNTNAQTCVGTPGQVKWSYWSGFNNSLPDSADLAALENFPSHPDGTQMLSSLKCPSIIPSTSPP